MDHAFFNETSERAVHVFAVRLQRLGKRRGGLGAVLEEMKIQQCLFFAEPKPIKRAVNSSSVAITDQDVRELHNDID